MTHQPRRLETIESDIQDALENDIPGLTSFIDGSFNDTWIRSYAEQVRLLEAKIVASQLALWVDYAGRDDLTRDDLENVGIDFSGWSDQEVSDFVDDVNSFMESVHLDELGELVGIDRDQGTKATGTVTITTASDSTQVQEGLEVATEPDSNGDYVSFLVDADGDGDVTGNETVTPSAGQTTVDVDIIAEEVGSEYNVGANSITFLPDPDPGIEDVTNASETSAGEDIQSDEDYRDDLKGSVISQSGGGTAEGIEGSIENVNGVADAEIDEFKSQQPPYVDVIVDGGSDSELTDEIDDVRPTGVQHNLVRPENINVGYRAELVGTDIDTTYIGERLDDYIIGLGIGSALRRSTLIQTILNSDSDVEHIGALSVPLTSVQNESHTYSTGTSIYGLDFAPLGFIANEHHFFRSGTTSYALDYSSVLDNSAVSVLAVVGGNETELVKGTDYQVSGDSIDFSIGGDNPDDETKFEVEYEIDSTEVDDVQITGTLSGSDHTFTQGTDFDIIDNDTDSLLDSIDWSIGGDSPDDGTDFFVDYDPKRSILDDQTTTVRQKVSLDSNKTTLNTYDL